MSEEEKAQLIVPKGAKSVMWKHFGFEADGQGARIDEKRVLCKHCHTTIAYAGNTTNMKQHLQNHHPHVLCQPGGSSGVVTQTKLDDIVKTCPKMPHTSKRAREITRSIAAFIAKDLRPIAVVEGAGFRQLLDTIDPSYQVPSRKHLMSVLGNMQEDVRGKILQELASAEFVSITTDFWTSIATESYLGVTVHFVTPDWNLKTRVLQTQQV